MSDLTSNATRRNRDNQLATRQYSSSLMSSDGDVSLYENTDDRTSTSSSSSIPTWVTVLGGGVAAVLVAFVVFKLVQWMWGTADRVRTTADPLATPATPVTPPLYNAAAVESVNESSSTAPTPPIDRTALLRAWLESKDDNRPLATHWREDAATPQPPAPIRLRLQGLSKAAMATAAAAGSTGQTPPTNASGDKPAGGNIPGSVNDVKPTMVAVTISPEAATAPFGITSNNQIKGLAPSERGVNKIGGDNPRLRKQIRAGQTAEETAFINDMCPLPYQLKMLGSPSQSDTTSATIHCYIPCPDGFEEVIIAPYADDRENPGNAQKNMYWACLAVCPDGVDETDSHRGCKAQMKYRARGAGWQHVKVPPYNMGEEVIAAHRDRVLPTNAANVLADPNSPDNKKRWKSPEFRALVESNFDFARRDTWSAVVGGEDLGRTVWFQNKGGFDWSFRVTDTAEAKGLHTYERYLMPTACGEDYDLSFDTPVPYFDFFNSVYGSMRDTISWGVPQYQHCYQTCPAFSTAIPSGTMESLRCLEQCPANTRRHPTQPDQCIKDGFKQEIKFSDVVDLMDSVFHSTSALPSAITAWRQEQQRQEAERQKHAPPPPPPVKEEPTTTTTPPVKEEPKKPEQQPVTPVQPPPPVTPPPQPHTQIPPPRRQPPPPPPGMPE